MTTIYDVGIFNVNDFNEFDIVVEDGDLKPDNGLETAVLISLFSNARIGAGEIPTGESTQGGWWADGVDENEPVMGSKLWLLNRSKISDRLAADVEVYCSGALKWMIDDAVAKAVSVSAQIANKNHIQISITITKNDGQNEMYSYLWDGQELKN